MSDNLSKCLKRARKWLADAKTPGERWQIEAYISDVEMLMDLGERMRKRKSDLSLGWQVKQAAEPQP